MINSCSAPPRFWSAWDRVGARSRCQVGAACLYAYVGVGVGVGIGVGIGVGVGVGVGGVVCVDQ